MIADALRETRNNQQQAARPEHHAHAGRTRTGDRG